MEKTPVKSKRLGHSGLLGLPGAVLLFAATAASAKTPGPEEIRSLTVKSSSELCFTAQECEFTLTLPGVEVSKIQSELSTLPPGIQFVSSRRDVYFDDETLQSGTRIQLWFTFSEPGLTTIPPLSVTVANRRYQLPFETVTVYENLATLSPKLTARLSGDLEQQIDKNGVLRITEGTEVVFTVAAQYCVQLVQFNWRLPKNAIFRETGRTETASGAFLGKTFTADEYELATFSWTPLAEGANAFPEVSMTAVAYNGMKRTVFLPSLPVRVEKASASQTGAGLTGHAEDAFLADAFSAPETESAEAPEMRIPVDCALLASLRSTERHSLPFSPARGQREAYERQRGLSSPAESRMPGVLFCYLLLGSIILLLAVLCIQKHHKRAAFCGCMAVFVLFACIHWTAKLTAAHAVYAGGDLRAIPEEKTVSSHYEAAGQRVLILEDAGEWVFIAAAESNGWVQKDTLYPIH